LICRLIRKPAFAFTQHVSLLTRTQIVRARFHTITALVLEAQTRTTATAATSRFDVARFLPESEVVAASWEEEAR